MQFKLDYVDPDSLEFVVLLPQSINCLLCRSVYPPGAVPKVCPVRLHFIHFKLPVLKVSFPEGVHLILEVDLCMLRQSEPCVSS